LFFSETVLTGRDSRGLVVVDRIGPAFFPNKLGKAALSSAVPARARECGYTVSINPSARVSFRIFSQTGRHLYLAQSRSCREYGSTQRKKSSGSPFSEDCRLDVPKPEKRK
jgi:hypothetical protein